MVKIITDGSCDLDFKTCAELGIELIPIKVHFDETTYTPLVDLQNDEFYSMLEKTEKLPTTTQVTPVEFEELFQKHIDNGDEVLGMFISKELSGTYQNAVMTANKINSEKIYIVDTLNTTFGLALLLHEAVKLRDEGLGAKAIAEKITNLVPRVFLMASVDTLKYLKMGGRLSAGSAIVAGILGIYPIISVVDGKVSAIGKVRGKNNVNKFIENKINEVGISSDYCVSVGNSNAPELSKQVEKHFSKYLNKRQKVINTSIGPVIGTHIGPGASGIAFIIK